MGSHGNGDNGLSEPRAYNPLNFNLGQNSYDASDRHTEGELPWAQRRKAIAQSIVYHRPGIIGLQEVLHHQLTDLLTLLQSMPSTFDPNQLSPAKWEYVGVGREDGRKEGEYTPIIFDSSRFKLDIAKTFWLSETPSRPSRGWDAANVRTCTAARFSPREFPYFNFTILNTHLDHIGVDARRKSAMLILEVLKSIDDPVFLMGDLNSDTEDDAYKTLSQSYRLGDTFEAAAVRFGNFYTFTGFDEGRTDPESRIDHIFMDKTPRKLLFDRDQERTVHISVHAVDNNRYDDGMYLSDHRPVIVDAIM